ncbi:MAG: phosphate/phosphite/phosphonate ABC transporter substrate-binding protein [Bermanella sp.]
MFISTQIETKKSIHSVVVLCFLCLLSSNTFADNKCKPLMVGLLPDDNTEIILDRFEPVRQRIEKAIGCPVIVAIPAMGKNHTYEDLVKHFIEGKIDVAYLGGLSYVKAASKIPTSLIAMRKKDTKFRSYFIAQRSLNIKSLKDLKGHSFAFGSSSSTSGHLMPRHYLMEKGINPSKDFKGEERFSGTHGNTLRMVMSGQVDAGVLNSNVYDRYLQEGKIDTSKVEVVWVTPGYSDYIWVSRESLNETQKNKLSEFFINLTPGSNEDSRILKLLEANYYISPKPKMFSTLRKVATKLNMIMDK